MAMLYAVVCVLYVCTNTNARSIFTFNARKEYIMITLHKDDILFDNERITPSLNVKLFVSSFIQVISDLCDDYDRIYEPFNESEEPIII